MENFNKYIQYQADDLIVLKKINSEYLNTQDSHYRKNFWAYAGDVLWCRDYYGRYYKIPELVIESYRNNIKLIQDLQHLTFGLSRLYMQLLMIHPFNDANGRSIYTFIAYLAYKYHSLIPYIVLLKNSDRLHESFRLLEHKAYYEIMCNAAQEIVLDRLHFDRRLKKAVCDIGYFNYNSLKIILFKSNYSCLAQNLRFFFNEALFNKNSDLIIYKE